MSNTEKNNSDYPPDFPPFNPPARKRKSHIPREPKQMTAQEKQLADAVLTQPKKPIKKIAREHGLSLHKTNEILALPQVNEYLAAEMTKAGLNLQKGLVAIRDGLSANKTQFFQKDGVVTDEREVIDHTTRLHAAELDLRLHGLLQPQQIQPQQQVNIASIVIAIKNERAKRGLPPIQVPLPSNFTSRKNNGNANNVNRV